MTDGATFDAADDEIVTHRVLPGITVIREHLRCSLHEALVVFADRYTVLRAERPGDFTCGHEAYWEGFHS
ncbi:hypothetical protein OG206_22950 [Streptomyces sp. NBC_01341]|uniref:hypothetical protein n=1 Tax=Streptomyces sp. NBC_01341 TaxID=2903831 RepID=UPI002E0EB1C8|nr:hypothetical protein OG206_22950 [Streptomyces sp. NBC_01341]